MCIPPFSSIFAGRVVLGRWGDVNYKDMVIIRWVNKRYVLDMYSPGKEQHALYVFNPSNAQELEAFVEDTDTYKALTVVLDLLEPRLVNFAPDPDKVREYLITREEYYAITGKRP